MSSQDKVERALKDIHVTFSKCKSYQNHPDQIIVDRKQFLELLDRLNMGIYEMLEEYEHTRQSRDQAEREFRKKGEHIINDARSYADDVYASSMLYTADMIGRVRDLMDRTTDSMNDLFRQFRRDMREQKDLLKTHETQMEGQLSDLADTKKYLSVLEDINQERKRRSRELEMDMEAAAKNVHGSTYVPPSAADIKVNDQYFEQMELPIPGQEKPLAAAAEKPDIIVNQDAAYFKWKESQAAQENGGEETVAAPPDAEPADEEPGTRTDEEPDGTENPDFPDEEAIRQAVLADELAAEQEELEKNAPGRGGSLLKRIIFGK